MAMVKLFKEIRGSNFVLVPFGIHPTLGGGNVATGDSIEVSNEEFSENGLDIILKCLRDFDTCDSTIPSHLYQVMAEEDRDKFFRIHKMMNISKPSGANEIRIRIGESMKKFGYFPLPIANHEFVQLVEEAYSTV